jgi:hypothetical protein
MAAYFACEAKFMAESSGQVGKEAAILAILKPDGSFKDVRFIFHKQIAKVKKVWTVHGAPRVPANMEKLIDDLAGTREKITQSGSAKSGKPRREPGP